MRRALILLLLACGHPVPVVDGGSAGGGTAGGSAGTGGGATAGGSAAGGSAAGGVGGGTAGGSAGGVTGGGSGGGTAFPAPAPEGCIQDVTAGARDYSCDSLRYHATIPASCLTAACGLIFDVHGFTMSAEMEEANSRLAARASQRGFIVVQPSANPAPPLSSWTPGTDDDKVFTTVQLFARVFHTDPKRLHFTGFSQGGAMTWRMLCKHADAWASVAPAAEQGCPFSSTDRPSREVPTLFLFGTQDLIVNFTLNAVPQRDAVISGWGMSAGSVVAADAGYTRTRYVSDAGTPFEFVQHEYTGTCIVPIGGHCFPGSTDPGMATGQTCSFKCNPPNAFDWGAEVLDWFERHPRP